MNSVRKDLLEQNVSVWRQPVNQRWHQARQHFHRPDFFTKVHEQIDSQIWSHSWDQVWDYVWKTRRGWKK